MFKTNMLIVGLLVSSLIGNVLLFLSIATIKRDLGALSSVLKYAKRRKLRKDNPALERLEDIVERRDPIVLPDPKDVELVISLAPGLMANLIRAAWVTGCRQAELVNVPRSNLDHKRKELTVIGKGNKLRVIDLVPFKGDKYLSKVPAHLRSKYLFWHSDRERFKNVHGHFARLVTKIAARNQDFRKFRFHDLRHLHAVEFLREGYGTIYDLQLPLGHASVSTTEVYLKYLTPAQVLAAKHGVKSSLPLSPQ
jgi:integrase/recombinase XerD